MVLRYILRKLPHKKVLGKGLDRKVESASSDSRVIFDNSIFIARRGASYNGLDFAASVKDKAFCFIASMQDKDRVLGLSKRYSDRVFVLVEDLDKAQDAIAEVLFKGAGSLDIIGVTGTNGKTTVSSLIHKILNDAGRPSALLGTVCYAWQGKRFPSFLTTPDNFTLKSILHKVYRDDIRHVVLEVSSHGLASGRLEGFGLKRAIFTNLSRDHLDFHKSLGNYFKAKCKIFDYLSEDGKAIANIDDRYGQAVLRKLKARALSFGIENKADYKVKAYRFEKKRLEFLINIRGKDRVFRASLLGMFNIYNVLAALACCDSLGLDLEKTRRTISRFKGPAGRLEEVSAGIFVDYAHTPNALRQSIFALRAAKFERIIVVFGCGGDRDRGKRPEMGRIASDLADHSIITLDNPRSEDPGRICKDIIRGVTGDHCEVVLDRRRAIKKALGLKKRSSWAVLIAGKGHEDYQIFKDRKVEFSDKKVVQELMNRP